MPLYETFMVISTKLDEDGIAALQKRFTDLIAANGSVISVNEWGKRRLAYEIQKETDGYYVLVTFESDPSFISELERLYRITDGLLRTLVVRKEHDLASSAGQGFSDAKSPDKEPEESVMVEPEEPAAGEPEELASDEPVAEEVNEPVMDKSKEPAAGEPEELASDEPVAEEVDETVTDESEEPAAEDIDETVADEPDADESAAEEQEEAVKE